MRSFTMAVLVAVGVLFVGCGKPPKQAAGPEVTESSGEDMAAQEAAPAPASTADSKPSAEAEQMHDKCCAECKTGLSQDRSGAKPESVPCADFTAALSPWCLEHFRARPTMAAECK
jgi:hypothetical protein